VTAPSQTGTQKTRKPSKPREKSTRHAIPDDWKPNDNHYQKAIAKGMSRDWVDEEADAMRNWAKAKGECKVDWDAAFHNWIPRSIEYQRGNGRVAPNKGYVSKVQPPTGQVFKAFDEADELLEQDRRDAAAAGMSMTDYLMRKNARIIAESKHKHDARMNTGGML